MKDKKIKPAKKSKKPPDEFFWDDNPIEQFQDNHRLLKKEKAKKARYDFREFYY